ncbi:MAG: hypothetical protein Q7Q73_01855 [Verrucomicrobiota bacterium JB024]|nr:hypothetical protein [Verrucomicrobiota bacterium JB024]
MHTFPYDNTSPLGVISQAAEYTFSAVMSELHWQADPSHSQAMLFVLSLHGHLGVRVSMLERRGDTLFRLKGIQGENCDHEEAAGLIVELQPTASGGAATLVSGTEAQAVWLVMMVSFSLDFVEHRHIWPPGIGVNWRSQHLGGETETWVDWFLVDEVSA